MSIRKGSTIIAGNIGQNVDSDLSLTSSNPVKNSVITRRIQEIEETTLGDNSRTNCITYIPQDIKLNLYNASLTALMGTKVYIPNGFEQDGVTRKFDELELSQDLVLSVGSSALTNAEHLIFITNDGTSSVACFIDNTFSGDNTPTVTEQNNVWYDTANNIIRTTADAGTTWSSTPISLPVAVITQTNALCTSIDNTLNGVGFIGNTFFALPGVKGLMPDGRNEDGTLRNTVVELTDVIIRTYEPQGKTSGQTFTYSSTNPSFPGCGFDVDGVYYVYDTDENIYYPTDNLPDKQARLKLARCFNNGSRIISITPNHTFHSVDYNDAEFIAHQAMPSNKYIDLIIGATGTTYTAPADGYVHVRTSASVNEGGWIDVNTGLISQGLDISRTGLGKVTIPVRKGQNFTVGYGGNTLDLVRFIYANGAI